MLKTIVYWDFQVMLIRQKQLTLSGKTELSTTTVPASAHHPGYAPNAAFHAIKRHALEFVNPKELMVRVYSTLQAIITS
jgi:AT-rich interactive domain-containing protein 2